MVAPPPPLPAASKPELIREPSDPNLSVPAEERFPTKLPSNAWDHPKPKALPPKPLPKLPPKHSKPLPPPPAKPVAKPTAPPKPVKPALPPPPAHKPVKTAPPPLPSKPVHHARALPPLPPLPKKHEEVHVAEESKDDAKGVSSCEPTHPAPLPPTENKEVTESAHASLPDENVTESAQASLPDEGVTADAPTETVEPPACDGDAKEESPAQPAEEPEVAGESAHPSDCSEPIAPSTSE